MNGSPLMTDRPPVARPNYFAGEALLTDDFQCEQRYHMEMLAVLNRGLHTYGIASGLQVYWQTGSQSRQVRVGAGMAINGLGQEIVLTEPQVVVMEDAEPGAMYFLTIAYYDAYADFTTTGGVPGFKRIVQQPLLAYSRTMTDEALNILLAVVNFSSQGTINTLSYKAGRYERRYVSGRFGTLDLVTEGSGIGATLLPLGDRSVVDVTTVSLSARRETDGNGNYLEVEADRAQFQGQLTTRGNLGIGLDHPQANLQVSSIMFEGKGTLTSNGTLLTLSDPISPPLQPGDAIAPTISLSAKQPVPPIVRIAALTDNPNQYQLDTPFTPNLTTPHSYSYVRWALARFSSPLGLDLSQSVDLLKIDRDGSIGLGVPSQPKGTTTQGLNALTISRDRRVGIGLADKFLSQASLEVAGEIQAGSLTVEGQVVAGGTVKAQSFEGNGSKLANLPILSYWTKVDVAAANSAIYYAAGNVGIKQQSPSASLTVGSGSAFVGYGLVTLKSAAGGTGGTGTPAATTTYTLSGSQTQFLSQVNKGDFITVGILDHMYCQVVQVISDTELVLDKQLPQRVIDSDYQVNVNPTDTGATPPSGTGTITSNGTRIQGAKTKFLTEAKQGSYLGIPQVNPIKGAEIGCRVQSVDSQAQVTLVAASDMGKYKANLSAYMVRPSLIGQFVDTSGMVSDDKATAMLVVANGPQPIGSADCINTVAINTPLSAVSSQYALQVTGATNFSGEAHFDQLSVDTLTVSETATIGGSQTPANTPALQIAGGPLQVETDATVTGAVTAGALAADQMTVPGLATSNQGLVTLTGMVQALGAPTPYSQADMTAHDTKDEYIRIFSQSTPVSTDGVVIANIGIFQQQVPQYAGLLEGTTSGGVTLYATSATVRYTIASSKKGGDVTVTLPVLGTLVLPVRKGETWTLTLMGAPPVPLANVTFYWWPLGGQAAAAAPALYDASAAPPHPFQSNLAGMMSGLSGTYSIQAAEQAIRSRVEDLTQVLGDATKMSADARDRQTFVDQLQKIVCSAQPPGTPVDNSVEDGDLDALIATFAKTTGKTFDDAQKKMLEDGVRALIAINATPGSRRDLSLIDKNIQTFLGNMETVLGQPFTAKQNRVLKKALSRLVGDGTQEVGGETDTREAT
ncbi:hypothetical protein amb1900 [Paramagnetospirillum magneticum AMB-1]|uniref:Uncharacterized protein n=2 Tax=Paramagnetospirillum magneticum TaxID=84159 RepID=Q2W621_PARM1|nr:hypothetical protein amb1900 [Paramagnetospirillum magneticum AMB-1]